MIAKKEYCEKVLKTPELLSDLIKKDNGATSPNALIRNLERESPTIRKSAALIETLRCYGISDREIFETETNKQS